MRSKPRIPRTHAERCRQSWRAGVLLAVLSLALIAPRYTSAEIIDRILAVVDGEVITLSDVSAALRFGFVLPPAGADPIRVALDRLIERQLMLREVERYGPAEPSPAAIDQAVAEIRDRFGGVSQLGAALAQSGMAEDLLRRRIRDDLRIRAYLDQRFAAVTPSPDDERRRTAIADWIAGLRRRAEVTVLYEPGVSAA
jgi:hypothetical protein